MNPNGGFSDRALADKIIQKVLTEKVSLEVALGGMAGNSWLREMTAGVLRNYSRYQWIIEQYAVKKKPTGRLARQLILATHQLLEQSTQPEKVVNEWVGEVKRTDGEPPSRFANAILRRVAGDREQWKGVPDTSRWSGIDSEGARVGLPSWIWKRWVRDYGVQKAASLGWVMKERPQFWTRDLVTGQSSRLEGSTQEAENQLKLTEGKILIQDISSQNLVNDAIAWVNRLNLKGVADWCAAPGGKAIGLASAGIEVHASDSNLGRLQTLRDNVKRVQLESRIQISEEPVTPLTPQMIWVDAPCSGTGTLRKNPEIRWVRGENELKNLVAIQNQLVERAWAALVPGGVMLYSVCSLFSEECWAHLERLKTEQGNRMIELARWTILPIDRSSIDEPGGDGFLAFLVQKSV